MSEQEAIEILKDGIKMKEEIPHLVPVYELAIEALEKQSMVNEILNESEQYKLALFGIIRNSKVMPVGLAQGKSMEEINAMSLKTMKEVLKMVDCDTMGKHYSEATETLKSMSEALKKNEAYR